MWATALCLFAEGVSADTGTKEKEKQVTAVTVTQNGNPVAGVKVISCDVMGKRIGHNGVTGADGVAGINLPAGVKAKFLVSHDRFDFFSDPVATPEPALITLPTDSRLVFTMNRQPVEHAKVCITAPDGSRYNARRRTDAAGAAALCIPEGMRFKYEIKNRGQTYFTPVYTAPADVRFDPLNTPPTAADMAVEAVSGFSVPVTLTGNDADGDALTCEILSQPVHGTLTGTAPNLTYTANDEFRGTDSFTYQVSDGIAESAAAMVSIDVAAPFVLSVNADDGTFTLPLKQGLAYDFKVYYDGQATIHTTDTDLTLTFPSGPGIYDVAVAGTFPAICFDGSADAKKVTELKQWGSIDWATMHAAFKGCSNMQVTATDTPDLSGVSDLSGMFLRCFAITSLDVTGWDVSNVTDMTETFRGCKTMTTLTGTETWDVSSVKSFHRTFFFNRQLQGLDLTGWDTSSATDMSYMFYRCFSIRTLKGYENFDVSNVTSFRLMFEQCRLPVLDLSNWHTTDALTDLRRMFGGSRISAIRGLDQLDVTNIQFADGMFNENTFQMTTDQYETLLLAWSEEVTSPMDGLVTFDAGDVQYTPFSEAAAAREHLIRNNWIINDGGSAAGIDPAPAESITSPVRVSGWTGVDQSPFSISTDMAENLPVTPWGDTLWYHDVTLNPAVPVPVSINYDGSTVKTCDITWTPTLIESGYSQTVTIRKGDSLLLGSAIQTGEVLEIDVDGDGDFDFTGSPADTFPVAYNEYGTFEVVTRLDGVEVGSITVNVPKVLFPENVACEIGYTRELTVGVPEYGLIDIVFTALNPAELSITRSFEPTLPGVAKLFITPLKSGTPVIEARAGAATGAVLETKTVDEFDIAPQADRFIGVVDEFEDGSMLLRTNLAMLPKVENLDVYMHIFKAGVTFGDSTLDKTVNTSDSIWDDEVGAYLLPYSLIIPPDYAGGPCHTLAVFQDGVQIGD